MKCQTMARYLHNGSLQILMIRDDGVNDVRWVELFLGRDSYEDRRFMAMRLRQARQVLAMKARALIVPSEVNEQISLF